MIERRFGEMTTLDTRGESHEQVDKHKRYQQIIDILKIYDDSFPLTAKEIAHEMYLRKLIPTDERNFTAPRLTELCKIGKVEPAGKVKCIYSGKTVTAYKLREV